MGICNFDLQVDQVDALTTAHVVPDVAQEIPDQEPSLRKIVLKTTRREVIPLNHMGHIYVKPTDPDYEGDVLIEASIRPIEGQEYCIPRVILHLQKDIPVRIPCINLSDSELVIKPNKIFARAWPCREEELSNRVLRILDTSIVEFSCDDVKIGPVTEGEINQLFELLNEYRDCFAQSVEEHGCTKATPMETRLPEDRSFTYRPYRMSRSEQTQVKEIADELLLNNIIRGSDSNYCSPVLLMTRTE